MEGGLRIERNSEPYPAPWAGLMMDGSHANAAINLQEEFMNSSNIADLFRKHGESLSGM